MVLAGTDEVKAIIGFSTGIAALIFILLLATSFAGVLTNEPGFRAAFLLIFGLFTIGVAYTLHKMDVWKNHANAKPIAQKCIESIGPVFLAAGIVSSLLP
jgi:hypothetical protein